MMAVELKILAWACVLLLVHIFAAAHLKTKQYGLKWNTGARDENLPPLDPVGGRLEVEMDNAEFARRIPAVSNQPSAGEGLGRELFAGFRAEAGRADEGAAIFWGNDPAPPQS
jgi:hypothetical protein